MVARKAKRDFTEGPIFTKMILFVIPIILTGVLQVAYNMADNIVVGQFSGDDNALGAVGSASSLTTLIINFLIGISSGAGIVVAQFYGAKNDEAVSKTVHSSMLFAVISGIAFMCIGLIFTKPLLILMDTNSELLSKAVLYMTIICYGIPASGIYNFGAAILRSIGDSRTSLYILAVSGITNVVLNLVFVICFDMSVDGVALATTLSKYVSAVWIVIVLIRRKNTCYGLNLKKLRMDKALVLRVMRFGVPIAVQNSIFNLSGVIVTGATNTFPKHTIAAKTIAFNIEGIAHTCMNGFTTAAMTFSAQNYGAKKYGRINKVLLYSLIQVATIGLVSSWIEIAFGRELAMLYIESGNPEKEAIIKDVISIFWVMLSTYFLCGVMSTLSGVLKGLGYSMVSVIASVIGVGVRVGWILILVPMPRFHNVSVLFAAYPISWIFTIILLSACCVFVWRKLGIMKKAREEKLSEETDS